jgi:2-dehydro-3-deoxygalactonokinase
MKGPFVALDWGTTNRRAFRIADGAASDVVRDDRGILASAGVFAEEAAALRRRFDQLPLLCVGMIGSARGWREVPYVAAPAGLQDLARGTVWVEPGIAAITPGVSLVAADRCDVMRGEEVQFLGAVAAGLVPAGALLCQPGTHAKWAQVQGDALRQFSTAMTGELFSLLLQHSLLTEVLKGAVTDGDAFRQGVEEARKRTLLTSLFGARAAYLLRRRAAQDGASFVSGLLIGTDVLAQLDASASEVYVLGDAPLGPLYCSVIEAMGGKAHLVDSAQAFIAGASRIWELLP